ncbi:hypothetical protein PILCRDRAFT_632899 [Piloderma croceum F 1598]|uniref:Uncharacterized protein n=1 Tax=Piloderma croceum (strain F 1598) TaxID=765440 RepID=A0A0C3FAC5_PILCF|nr:hypothetical protein PILCRDRAFT_632899 [Piloderma croceum F 1598]
MRMYGLHSSSAAPTAAGDDFLRKDQVSHTEEGNARHLGGMETTSDRVDGSTGGAALKHMCWFIVLVFPQQFGQPSLMVERMRTDGR